MTRAELDRIAKQQERSTRQAFIASVTGITDAVLLAEVERYLAAGDVDSALAAINVSAASFAPLTSAVAASYAIGAATTAKEFPRFPAGGAGPSVAFVFDVRNPRAERWLAAKSSTRVVEIVDDQLAMLRRVMTAGMVDGRNPRNVALDIVGRIDRATGRRTGGFIGLTEQQAGYVANMRRELESGDTSQMLNYFTRERRDKRLDGIVKRAIRDEKPVSAKDMDSITARYSDRLLQLRGENIARTESLDALRAGQAEAVTQAMEQADIRPSEAQKEWSTSGDERTRMDHAIAEGQRVPMNQPFRVGGYLLRYPGDSSLGAPASQTIQCRCRSRTDIDFLGRALRIEGF